MQRSLELIVLHPSLDSRLASLGERTSLLDSFLVFSRLKSPRGERKRVCVCVLSKIVAEKFAKSFHDTRSKRKILAPRNDFG